MTRIACQGCSTALDPDDPAPFRCPRAGSGDDVDHVLSRTLDPSGGPFPHDRGEKNPFVRYRTLFHAHALALRHGMRDEEFVALVRKMDRAIGALEGHGFVATPFGRSAALSERFAMHEPGGVWIKDETGNVSGSHKARHLFGLALFLETVEQLGLRASGKTEVLAIASCGNAALAAAVVARACQRRLAVFIPVDADQAVVSRLRSLDAEIHVCPREPGVAGDPCYHAFRRAVDAGAVPFCCQGCDNGLTIEGGETIGWEMVTELVASGRSLDRLFVQVGGGALASACIQAFREAAELGVPIAMPRLHAVQTRGGFPLRRAWLRLVERLLSRLSLDASGDDRSRAERLLPHASSSPVAEELRYAATHRSSFMWPWETEPKSVAHGILDDETYDWLAIVSGMIGTGGYPIVVDEPTLKEANELGRSRTGIDVDATGSAGLAGALSLHDSGALPSHESVAVIFSGVTRR